MIRNYFLIICLFFTANLLIGQDSISLQDCYDFTMKNHPIIQQKGIYSEISEKNIKNINSNYLPNFSISGQATYQSDVTSFNIEMPTIPGIGKTPSPQTPTVNQDQYKITADVNQVIYNGGIINISKELENTDFKVKTKEVEVNFYKIKQNINEVYFNILILQENIIALNLLKSDINDKILSVSSGVKNGILMQSNLNILKAELLKIEQTIIDIEYNKYALLEVLSRLTSMNFDNNSILSLPNVNMFSLEKNDTVLNRPEIELFKLNKQKIEVSNKLIQSKYTPSLFGFAQLGYGNPGLNMISNSFDSFYIVGAKLSWDIINWNKNKRDSQILKLNSSLIDNNIQIFIKNNNIELAKSKADIEKFESLISKDNDIIALRENITKSYVSQLENGIITANDYITEKNEETKAKINLSTHKIQLVKSKINYKTIMGN